MANLDFLSIKKLEEMGAFVKPTGKKGRPRSSIGTIEQSSQFRIASQVAKMAALVGNISEAQRQVSQQEKIPYETVKTYCKRYLRLANTSLIAQKNLNHIMELRHRLVGAPDTVIECLFTRFNHQSLKNLLDFHDIQHGAPLWLSHRVQLNNELSDIDFFLCLMQPAP